MNVLRYSYNDGIFETCNSNLRLPKSHLHKKKQVITATERENLKLKLKLLTILIISI